MSSLVSRNSIVWCGDQIGPSLICVIDDNPIVGSLYNFVSTIVISCWTFENFRIGNPMGGSSGLNNLRLLTLMDLPYRRLTF